MAARKVRDTERWSRHPNVKKWFDSTLLLKFMKNENEKLVKYHLDEKLQNDSELIEEIERIKNSGRRLTGQQRAELLKKLKPSVYSV